ncbi:MAG: hypothetical protein GF310_13055 [candidate division Zixibacteria bacterium]|nr:hypothetical protein [candidate division Zixibacteria bacterium]
MNQSPLLLCDAGHKYKQDMIVLSSQSTPESAIKFPESVNLGERHFSDLMRQAVASVATQCRIATGDATVFEQQIMVLDVPVTAYFVII